MRPKLKGRQFDDNCFRATIWTGLSPGDSLPGNPAGGEALECPQPRSQQGSAPVLGRFKLLDHLALSDHLRPSDPLTPSEASL